MSIECTKPALGAVRLTPPPANGAGPKQMAVTGRLLPCWPKAARTSPLGA